MPSAKRKAVIIDIKIFDAAAGFLPKAFTEAYPTRPITAAGPSVLKNIISVIVKFSISHHYH